MREFSIFTALRVVLSDIKGWMDSFKSSAFLLFPIPLIILLAALANNGSLKVAMICGGVYLAFILSIWLFLMACSVLTVWSGANHGFLDKELYTFIRVNDYGTISKIPNTSIEAYALLLKKGNFQIFDYKEGLIVSILTAKKGERGREYVNLRFDYENYFRLVIPKSMLNSLFLNNKLDFIRKHLEKKWWSQYIVDLNDPYWEEKLAQTLKENEKLLYPGKKQNNDKPTKNM